MRTSAVAKGRGARQRKSAIFAAAHKQEKLVTGATCVATIPGMIIACRGRCVLDQGVYWMSANQKQEGEMTMPFTKTLPLGVAAIGLLIFGAVSAHAEDTAPKAWSDIIKVSGHVEVGATVSSPNPSNGINFGHLFTDKEGEVALNQAMLTVERPIDSSSKNVDIGFKLQGMYGSDARYTHFLGELDRATNRRNQFDIVEAYVNAHLPILTSGGVDVKAGQYVTLEGAEVIDATGNFFYSHTYIFNFGIPFKHTGVMTTTHFSHGIDVYLGVDSGVNTTFGSGGDNNGALAFHGGIGFPIGKKVTMLATTHIGPENPRGSFPNYNSALRYLNDVTVIWKLNSKLTSTTDLNYIRDDGFSASGGGVAQYFTYAVNDKLGIGIRGEVWRDSNGFFVAAFPSNRDFVNVEKGLPAPDVYGGGNTTYGAVTLGLNFKPPLPVKGAGLNIRPEVRYDWSLNGTNPFSAGTRKHQFTAAIDAILSF
jgi:hypothetical protein